MLSHSHSTKLRAHGSSPVVGRSLDLLNQHARFECRIRSMVAEVLGAIVQGAQRPSSRRLPSVETRAFAFRSFGQELNRSDWYYAQNSIRGTAGGARGLRPCIHRVASCAGVSANVELTFQLDHSDHRAPFGPTSFIRSPRQTHLCRWPQGNGGLGNCTPACH